MTVFGDGRQTRDYVFVKDVARANLAAARAKLPPAGRLDARAFNVGTGIETLVLELATALGRPPVARSSTGTRPRASWRAAAVVGRGRQGRGGARLATADDTGAGSVRDIGLVCRAPPVGAGDGTARRGTETMSGDPTMILQVASAVPTTPWGLVLSSTPVTRGVVVLLAVLSLVSWTIMFAKWAEFAGVRRRSAAFPRDLREHSTDSTRRWRSPRDRRRIRLRASWRAPPSSSRTARPARPAGSRRAWLAPRRHWR